MRGDLPAGGIHGRDMVRRTCQRRGDTVDRHRYAGLGKHAVQAPEACAGAIFVDRLHVPVALAGPGSSSNHFRQEGLRGRIAMQDAVLAAFFVVDDELHGDMGATRPFRVRRIGSVTAHIPYVTHHSSLPVAPEVAPRYPKVWAAITTKFLKVLFGAVRSTRAYASPLIGAQFITMFDCTGMGGGNWRKRRTTMAGV